MANEIISYIDMCQRERSSLQRGMNFSLGGTHSMILMSRRPNAPYRDQIEDGGSVLIYEGHDAPKTKATPDPKVVDQPIDIPSGAATQNGLFFSAAQNFKTGKRLPEKVRVYEKLRQGICSYNGIFHLIDAWQEHDGKRKVFKFKLEAVEGEEDLLAIPAVTKAPLGSIVYYGQPKVGVVMVAVDEEARLRAGRTLRQMARHR